MTAALDTCLELTTAAAVLLMRATARHADTGLPLGEEYIALPARFQLSHTGPGTRIVTAGQAWDELLSAGLITGTRTQWAPSHQEVIDDGLA